MPDLPRSHLIAYGLALLAVVGFGLRQVAHSRSSDAPAGVPLKAGGGGAAGSGASGPAGGGASGSAGGSAGDGASGGSSGSRKLVVHVAGAVRRPGVYRFDDGLRVDDAVRRAGGPRRGADLSQLNLAAELEDGRQVLVPLSAAALAAGAARGGAGGTGSGGGGAGAAGSGAAGGAAGAATGGTGGAGGGTGGLGGGTPGSAGAGTGAVAGPPLNLNTATVEQLDTLDGVGPVTAQKILAYRQEHNGFGSIDELGEIPGIGPKRLAALRERVTV